MTDVKAEPSTGNFNVDALLAKMAKDRRNEATKAMLARLSFDLFVAIATELRDAALAFQGPTETPAEAGQRATRLRAAVELATAAIEAVQKPSS